MLWNFRRGRFANGLRLPLDCVRTVGELRTVSRLLLGRARKKTIRINLFVVVGVIRLIIVAVIIIANTIIIIAIIRIRKFRPFLLSSF